MKNETNPKHLVSRKIRTRSLGLVLLLGFLLLGLSWMAAPQGYTAQEQEKKSDKPVQVKQRQAAPVQLKTTRIQGQQNPQPNVAPEGPHPVVKVMGEPSFDFGNFWIGDPVEHTFKLKNEGDAVLLIQSVKPG